MDTAPPTVAAWSTAVAEVLADPAPPRMAYQPMVDVQRGTVAGYEALARFQGPITAPPDAWFRAADQLGLGAELEARAVAAALACRDDLPEDTFLTVNVSPALLDDPCVRSVLEDAGRLDRVVLELTEHVAVDDYARLARSVDWLRARGAAVAVDDAGAGYASLSHILAIRPSFVKLDRRIVDGVDRDGGKLALVEMLGTFASRIDAWVVAEGVERQEELDALARLGVPLAQGWLLGRPAAPWAKVPADVVSRLLRGALARRQRTTVAGLVEEDGEDWSVVLDDRGWPEGVLAAGATAPHPVLRVLPGSPLAEVARRAMTRPAEHRFAPLVCCDERGSYQGLIRVERLVERLSAD